MSSLCAAFQACAARHPDRVALRLSQDRVRLTYAEYAAAVERVAGALASLGVQHGDRVMFLSPNSPRLAIAETATLHLGGATVIAPVASTATGLEHRLHDAEPVVLVFDPALVEGRPSTSVPAIPLDELDALEAPASFDFGAAWRAVQGEEVAGILYTSGTTGPPKAVQWRHGSVLACFGGTWPASRPIHDVSWMPMAELSERLGGHWRGLIRGSTRTFCPDPAALGAVLVEARPTFITGHPRFWQQLRVRLEASLDSSERAAVEHAIALVEADRPIDRHDALLTRLRARVGMDRMERAVTAGAACPRSVQVFFHALGLPFGELYGSTELGPVTQTRPGTADLGTVGAPLGGVQVAIADDGEVLVRSRADGWVRTGDIGVLDKHSRLRIVARKDELIISSEGHNMAPGPIEAELKGETALIAEVCVIGNGRPHNVALIVLEPAALAGDPTALAAVRDAVDAANARLEPPERVVRYAVLPDAWLTAKLRRTEIEAEHAAVIEGLYDGASGDLTLGEPAEESFLRR